MALDNKSLGRFDLVGIPPAPRGIPQIEVTFDIDANGILNVSAKDKATNKQQSIRIEASSGLSDADIKKMRAEAEANADADKKAKERIDKLNHADSLIFQTEKQLKEFGDKLPADKKGPIESALQNLKDAHKNEDIDSIDKATEELNKVFQAASEEMYKNAQTETNNTQQPHQEQQEQSSQNNAKKGAEVQDVDFEEVK